MFEIVDSVGKRSSILKAVCMGTTYDQAWIVTESESLGSPLSQACLRAFVHGWTRWAGCPRLVRCDRRTHNRGVFSSILAKNDQAWIVRESESLRSPPSHACLRAFVHGWTCWAGCLRRVRFDRRTHNRGVCSSILAKNGVAIRPAGLEAPEQIERVERRCDMLKKMMSKGIKDTHASGRESVDMILSECKNAANDMTRRAGFAPAQWVLSRLPRSPATMSRCGC